MVSFLHLKTGVGVQLTCQDTNWNTHVRVQNSFDAQIQHKPQLPANVHPRRQQKMASALGSWSSR